MDNIYKNCLLCERRCKINRYEKKGVCGASNKLKVALSSLHMWEEPCISGNSGSGTIFFSHCNLKCLFCQNKKISTNGYGKEISIKDLTRICLELQERKANNINLVTPTHYIPSIVKGIKKAKKEGLNIPIVYNTSSYETIEGLNLLNNIIDIYLADLKYKDNKLGENFSNVKNYFEIASRNIDIMYKQVGNPIIENGIMKKGVIVRVLLLPNHLDDAKEILKYLYEKYKDNIYISIMNQYTPVNKIEKYEELNYKVTTEEYDELIDYACDLGITKAFIQEGETQVESFIPNFNKSGL